MNDTAMHRVLWETPKSSTYNLSSASSFPKTELSGRRVEDGEGHNSLTNHPLYTAAVLCLVVMLTSALLNENFSFYPKFCAEALHLCNFKSNLVQRYLH